MSKFYLQSAVMTIEDRVLPLRSVNDKDGLYYTVSISRDKYKYFGNIQATLFNVNDATFGAINKKRTGNQYFNVANIKFEAGYGGNNFLLFNGTIFRSETNFSPGEKSINLVISDYSEKTRLKRVKKEYRTKPKLSEACSDFASAIGIGVDTTALNPSDNINASLKSYSATISEFMASETAANSKIGMSVQNDILRVYSISQENSPVIEITPQTGMVLSPVRTDQNLIRVQTFFNPAYQIGTGVRVKSDRFEQSEVTGTIFRYTHNIDQVNGRSTIEILPTGQTIPRRDIGIGI